MSPFLTIAIPTYNRADFLALNLAHLEEELRNIDHRQVEILVSDNASTDDTREIVESAAHRFDIRYVRQEKNIGSDQNFVFCFQHARGKYLLLLSDDDILGKNAIDFILDLLIRFQPGAICLRAFGYDQDLESEWPQVQEKSLKPLTPDQFLCRAGAFITLISSCVVRRTQIDPEQYVGSNLVQVPMVMEALASGPNFVTRQYWLACKRNNSGSYDFFKVFGNNLIEILAIFEGRIFSSAAMARFKRKLLMQFFPQYIFKAIRNGGESAAIVSQLKPHFSSSLIFRIFYRPLTFLPPVLALVWSGAVAFWGRLIYGDGWRMFLFLLRRLSMTRGDRSR